ncbi:hypothetical protein BU23DRAFT_638548 [Bimuria novae-zelandiae CBS 107.79]|uniref:Uncharacterized protein n=1 Tax=Bimuria novae-zelandiae CBS 107.79 TaxID=1447943 RepID=A0A6A5V9C0_9PLEO|nr:hypothetical protein BU23DRAFT_638548 [Bimuria novae-zelandiae CBS 107.79]
MLLLAAVDRFPSNTKGIEYVQYLLKHIREMAQPSTGYIANRAQRFAGNSMQDAAEFFDFFKDYFCSWNVDYMRECDNCVTTSKTQTVPFRATLTRLCELRIYFRKGSANLLKATSARFVEMRIKKRAGKYHKTFPSVSYSRLCAAGLTLLDGQERKPTWCTSPLVHSISQLLRGAGIENVNIEEVPANISPSRQPDPGAKLRHIDSYTLPPAVDTRPLPLRRYRVKRSEMQMTDAITLRSLPASHSTSADEAT